MDEILLHKAQKVSTEKEASKFLEYDYDYNELYQVENKSTEYAK